MIERILFALFCLLLVAVGVVVTYSNAWVARSVASAQTLRTQRWSVTTQDLSGQLLVYELRDGKTDSCYVVVANYGRSALAIAPAQPCPE